MLRTAVYLLALSVPCLAQDATWLNLTDEGWCYYPKADYTSEVATVPSKQYCLPNSFKLRSVDTNYLSFVYEGGDYPTIHLTFEGGASEAQKSVAHRVLPKLVFQREYWEDDIRILRFGPSEPSEGATDLHQVYVEFPTGAVITIWGKGLHGVETALSDLLE